MSSACSDSNIHREFLLTTVTVNLIVYGQFKEISLSVTFFAISNVVLSIGTGDWSCSDFVFGENSKMFF